MAKYDRYNMRSRATERPWKIHPIWRGIGCMMMIIIPIMAYAGAVLLVQLNQQMGWLPVPYELSQTITLPTLGAIPFLFANLLTALLLSLAGFAILTLFYSLIYKFFGPPQYGQLDADPREVRRPVKRRKY